MSGRHRVIKENPRSRVDNLKSKISINKAGMPIFNKHKNSNQIMISKNKTKKYERLTSFPREGNTYTIK
jgi:hypothetical protein